MSHGAPKTPIIGPPVMPSEVVMRPTPAYQMIGGCPVRVRPYTPEQLHRLQEFVKRWQVRAGDPVL